MSVCLPAGTSPSHPDWTNTKQNRTTEYQYLFQTRRMPSSGMCRRVARVRTDVSEESITIIRMKRITELGITLTVPSNAAPKRRFLQEPHGITSKRAAVFIGTAVKASNVTYWQPVLHVSVECQKTVPVLQIICRSVQLT
jgi:hypothetical protein